MNNTTQAAGSLRRTPVVWDRLADGLSASIAERTSCGPTSAVWQNETIWAPTNEDSQGCLVRWSENESAPYWWFSRQAANVVVDWVLGGSGAIDRVRPLTDVDRRLLAKFVGDVILSMNDLLGEIGLSDQAEPNATTVKELADGDPYRAIRFRLQMGPLETESAWLMPEETVQRCVDLFDTGNVEPAREETIRVVLGEIDLPADEVAGLELGDTIVLETDANQPLTAILQDEAYLVDPGSDQGQKAIRLRQSKPQ